MKLSNAVEQACCIMALLASNKPATPITTDTLAKRMNVSPTYLKKITRKLVVNGIITSAQGVRGGLALARSMETITLRDVVEAVEGHESFFRPQGIIEHVFESQKQQAKRGVTVLEEAFAAAQAEWEQCLHSVTLKDVVEEVCRERKNKTAFKNH